MSSNSVYRYRESDYIQPTERKFWRWVFRQADYTHENTFIHVTDNGDIRDNTVVVSLHYNMNVDELIQFYIDRHPYLNLGNNPEQRIINNPDLYYSIISCGIHGTKVNKAFITMDKDSIDLNIKITGDKGNLWKYYDLIPLRVIDLLSAKNPEYNAKQLIYLPRASCLGAIKGEDKRQIMFWRFFCTYALGSRNISINRTQNKDIIYLPFHADDTIEYGDMFVGSINEQIRKKLSVTETSAYVYPQHWRTNHVLCNKLERSTMTYYNDANLFVINPAILGVYQYPLHNHLLWNIPAHIMKNAKIIYK